MHPETQDFISQLRNYTENRQQFVWNTENRRDFYKSEMFLNYAQLRFFYANILLNFLGDRYFIVGNCKILFSSSSSSLRTW